MLLTDLAQFIQIKLLTPAGVCHRQKVDYPGVAWACLQSGAGIEWTKRAAASGYAVLPA
jgi:hypothetical protein